jgi:hypothetical protein
MARKARNWSSGCSGGALHVLRQAIFLGDAVGADYAWDWLGLGQALLLHHQLQRPITPGDVVG